MVDSIEISIKSGINTKYSSLFDFKNNLCIINDKKIMINDITESRLLRIIRTWKNNYGNSNNIDAEEFLITVISNNVIEIIKGKGNYPNNYDELLEFLGDLYD